MENSIKMKIKVFGFFLAGLCLMRVVSVSAASRQTERYDAVETYTEDSALAEDTNDSNSRSVEQDHRAEIRLSRPEEAQARIEDESGAKLVPGAERLMANADRGSDRVPDRGQDASTIHVPTRKLASVQESVSSPSESDLMVPKPMEPSRVAQFPNRGPLSEITDGKYGLTLEPRLETKVGQALPSSVSKSGVQEVSVISSDYGFFPSRIVVTQNMPVKLYLTSTSKNTLCFMVDSFGLKKGIAPGKIEEVMFTPEQSGEFRFYCPVKSIEGKLVVREAPIVETASEAAPSYSRRISSSERSYSEGASQVPQYNTPKNAAQLRQLIED